MCAEEVVDWHMEERREMGSPEYDFCGFSGVLALWLFDLGKCVKSRPGIKS